MLGRLIQFGRYYFRATESNSIVVEYERTYIRKVKDRIICKLTQSTRDCTKNVTGLPALRMTSTARS